MPFPRSQVGLFCALLATFSFCIGIIHIHSVEHFYCAEMLGAWIDGYRQLAPAINGSVTTFVNTRALVCSFDRRNSTPLFLTGSQPKPAATPPIYPRSCPDLPLLSPVECQSWDQPPLLLPRGSAIGAVTRTVLKKQEALLFVPVMEGHNCSVEYCRHCDHQGEGGMRRTVAICHIGRRAG